MGCSWGQRWRVGGWGRGVKRAKNSPKWRKNSVCTTPFLRNHTWYGCHFWCRCINCQMISPDLFFYFFKILVLRVVKEVKGKKFSKMIKISVLLYIFGKSYIRGLSFMVHICKVIISPGIFSFFKDFLGCSWGSGGGGGGEKGKKWSKMPYSWKIIHHRIVI